jgi:hypothetical protein
MWVPGGVLTDATPLSFYEIAETLRGSYALHGLLSFMRKWSLHAALKRGLSEGRKVPPELLLDSEALPKTTADEAYEAALSDRLKAVAATRNIRLSFFAYPHRTGLKIDVIPEEALLGSALVTMINAPNYKSSVVSDCVVRCPLLLNNYVHLQREFTREVRGRPFRIQGTYFCQQDGLTGVCAHAAVRMYLANHPRGPRDLPSYEHINRHILGFDADRVRCLGTETEGGGLSAPELVTVLSSYSLNAFIHDYDHEPDRDYAADVYAAVESQVPALLAFRTNRARHVVVAVGHTLNTDLWLPQVQLEYFEEDDGLLHHHSNMWVEDYIVHDDNFGMLQCLPARCLGANPNAPAIADKRVLGLLGLGGKALACVSDRQGNVDGKNAEILALDILYNVLPQLMCSSDEMTWLCRLKEAVTTPRRGPVLRTFQTSKADYLGHLELIRDREGLTLATSAVNLAEAVLPDHFWITEFTLPDLYTANKSKLGELLCSASDPQANEPSGGMPEFLLLRLPGYITVKGPRSEPTPPYGHVEILHQPTKALQW